MIERMRTTLDIDDDVLQAAKEIAGNRGTTAGKVISQWVREAIRAKNKHVVSNGVPVLQTRTDGRIHTMADVNRIRDEE